MKDLIIVSAHCPDEERKSLLQACVNSLQPIRDRFDILIISHTYVPEHIALSSDYVIYDKSNELITDWDMMNTPWFRPYPGLTIISSLVSNYSVYLAVYRLLIPALGFAKNFGYKAAHFLEYDSLMVDPSEIIENSKIINDYVAIQYKDEFFAFDEDHSQGAVGFFQTFNLDLISESLTNFNRELLLKKLADSRYKTNEVISQQLLLESGRSIKVKPHTKLIETGNRFKLSANTSKDALDHWTIPYYEPTTGKVHVLVWNSKSTDPITATFIFNKDKVVSVKDVNHLCWQTHEVDPIESVDEILVIVNDRIKCKVQLNTPELKQKFMRTNVARHS